MTTRKTALVTGGNRGIGRATVLAFAEQGVDVILTYRSGRADAEATVAEVKARGGTAVALPLDVGVTGGFHEFVATVRGVLRSTWSRSDFDILINNAGHAYTASIANTSEDGFDLLVDVHLKGAYFLTQQFLPLMVDGAASSTTPPVSPGSWDSMPVPTPP